MSLADKWIDLQHPDLPSTMLQALPDCGRDGVHGRGVLRGDVEILAEPVDQPVCPYGVTVGEGERVSVATTR